MKLTGVEVPFENVFKLEPNTFLALISDNKGVIRLVQVDRESVPENDVALRVIAADQAQGGCFVRIDGEWVWFDPCPY
jgi:hypothetical protein